MDDKAGKFTRAGVTLCLTGFAPFARLTVNPSSRVLPRIRSLLQAELDSWNCNCVVVEELDVACDSFFKHREFLTADLFVSLGVALSATKPRVERAARNLYRDEYGERALDADRNPGQLIRSRFPHKRTSDDWGSADDESCGTYACNALFFLALSNRTKPSYFLHVPNFPPEEDEHYGRVIADEIARIMRVAFRSS